MIFLWLELKVVNGTDNLVFGVFSEKKKILVCMCREAGTAKADLRAII